MGPWDSQTMILMGPRALGMGPTIDVFFFGKFKMHPQDAGSLVADESHLSFDGCMMQDKAISESLHCCMQYHVLLIYVVMRPDYISAEAFFISILQLCHGA